MSQYDQMFDLTLQLNHSDIHFIVQWFCLYILKIIWLMNIIVWNNDCDRMFDANFTVGQNGLYFMVQWFWPKLNWMNVIVQNNDSVGSDFWSQIFIFMVQL